METSLVFRRNLTGAPTTLSSRIQTRTGVRVQSCYQCGKCSAGCPVAPFMDLTPRQVMRAVQLDQTDLALGSSAIWLCAGCQTCSARCPAQIDIARVMESLRQLACTERARPAERAIALSHNLFLASVRRLGRLHEVGVVAALNLRRRTPFANVRAVGLPLLARGKLNLLPARAGGAALRRLFAQTELLAKSAGGAVRSAHGG